MAVRALGQHSTAVHPGQALSSGLAALLAAVAAGRHWPSTFCFQAGHISSRRAM